MSDEDDPQAEYENEKLHYEQARDDYDWHDRYVREVQRNHDLGLKVASLKARLEGLVNAVEKYDAACEAANNAEDYPEEDGESIESALAFGWHGVKAAISAAKEEG